MCEQTTAEQSEKSPLWVLSMEPLPPRGLIGLKITLFLKKKNFFFLCPKSKPNCWEPYAMKRKNLGLLFTWVFHPAVTLVAAQRVSCLLFLKEDQSPS